MSNFMLVITLVIGQGAEQSVVLSTGLTFSECEEMVYYVEDSLKDNAYLTCETDMLGGNES